MYQYARNTAVKLNASIGSAGKATEEIGMESKSCIDVNSRGFECNKRIFFVMDERSVGCWIHKLSCQALLPTGNNEIHDVAHSWQQG